MAPKDLIDRLNDYQFEPFRVHLSGGSRLDVTHAGLVVVGESSAVLPSVWAKDDEGYRIAQHWRTIALAHIIQFGEVDEPVEGKTKKRRRPK